MSLNAFLKELIFTLQGGIAFVAIKGAFKVYFKQQQYLRQAHRKILNFPEQEEAWGGRPDEPHTHTHTHLQHTHLQYSTNTHLCLEGSGGGGGNEHVRLGISVAPLTCSSPLSPVLEPPSFNTRIPSTAASVWTFRRIREVKTDQTDAHRLTHIPPPHTHLLSMNRCRVDVT